MKVVQYQSGRKNYKYFFDSFGLHFRPNALYKKGNAEKMQTLYVSLNRDNDTVKGTDKSSQYNVNEKNGTEQMRWF